MLRRYRRDADVTGEAQAMRHLAGLGYPVPAVYEATGREMVLARLDGPTMAQALATAALGLAEAARTSPSCCAACTSCRRGRAPQPAPPSCIWTCTPRTC